MAAVGVRPSPSDGAGVAGVVQPRRARSSIRPAPGGCWRSSAAPGAIEDSLDGELGAGVLPGAVLTAVAGGEVDRGSVGQVEREPGHLRAATAAAVAGVTV